MDRPKPQILCVDDDLRLLEALSLVLRKDYDVHTASSPEQALQKLREVHDLAVVVSDMRMPKMDGAALLHEILLRRPDAARIMLTGYADRDEAVRAVNQGQIFRFLTKPCPMDQLKAAIDAGVIQHRLVNAERRVLQETLLGCIKALMEVLALANPVAFGHASSIKRRAMEMAARLGTPDFWQLEAAALLSQLGYAALPMALLEKVYLGQTLTAEEQAKLDSVPDMANKLLEHIPRLEPVIQILAALKWNDTQLAALGDGTIGLGTRILSLILEYDALAARGLSHELIRAQLAARSTRFGSKLVEHLDICIGAGEPREQALEIPLAQVACGMILQEELRTPTGVLIVPKGFEVSKTFLDRIGTLAPQLRESKVRVSAAKA